MDSYLFPAILDPGENQGYTVSFPDLPGCITEGDTIEEALDMATEALELHLYGLERDGDPIPAASSPGQLRLSPGAFVSMVKAWMPPVREELNSRAVKKTLTIPRWLNDIAEKKGVNFSHVLQAALKNLLGVPDVRQR